MKHNLKSQKTVTELPKLPKTLAWHIVEAHHSGGTTFWLRMTDSLWNEVAQYGWRTGYVPTSEQLIHRAKMMMNKAGIEAVEEGQS
ncbi:MAG: hypothetical protein HLX51_00520 [Micrococcaceae bacterium]|nr:hypothetical protein [Micrococcaceae bacterium]